MDKKAIGNVGEKVAKWYLQLKLYKILKTNFYTKHGEIDIIAQKGKTIVFVEVKTRTGKDFGEAKEAVNYYKQNHMKMSAMYYLGGREVEDIRFDVIEVYGKVKNNIFLPNRINHIKDVLGW